MANIHLVLSYLIQLQCINTTSNEIHEHKKNAWVCNEYVAHEYGSPVLVCSSIHLLLLMILSHTHTSAHTNMIMKAVLQNKYYIAKPNSCNYIITRITNYGQSKNTCHSNKGISLHGYLHALTSCVWHLRWTCFKFYLEEMPFAKEAVIKVTNKRIKIFFHIIISFGYKLHTYWQLYLFSFLLTFYYHICFVLLQLFFQSITYNTS